MSAMAAIRKTIFGAQLHEHVNVNRKSLGKRLIEHWQLYVFLAPAIILIFIFNYMPMYGIQMAFRDFRPISGIWGSEWVGLAHFERLVNLPAFVMIIRNTFILSIMSISLGFIFPITLALMLNQIRSTALKRVIQTVTYMPHFISVVVVVGMLMVFFSPRTGLYGLAVTALGGTPTNIIGRTDLFRWFFVLTERWQHTGFAAIIYIAAMSGIDPELYEAASIDGASQWKKMIHIDIPSIVPVMIILLILSAGNVLNVGFERAFLMQNPTNIEVSQVIATYVFEVGIRHGQFSFSAAVSLLNTLINFVVLVAVNTISRRVSSTSLW